MVTAFMFNVKQILIINLFCSLPNDYSIGVCDS